MLGRPILPLTPCELPSKAERVAANGRPLGRAGDLAVVRAAFRRAPEWAVRGRDPERFRFNSGWTLHDRPVPKSSRWRVGDFADATHHMSFKHLATDNAAVDV